MVHGKLDVPAGKVVPADLVATESAVLGEGCRIEGSVKARYDVTVGFGVRVTGSAVAGRDVIIGTGARVGGPVISEREVVLGHHSVVGSREMPATVTTEVASCRSGARCHGTVWARDRAVLPVPDAGTAAGHADEPAAATEETVP